MTTTLFMRDTTLNGIGSFRDAVTVRGGASTTGIVNSTASGTNIQWTKTAGGAALEWISGKSPVGGWTLSGLVTVRVRALESSMNNNVGGRIRLYKRSAAGSETELTGSPWDDGVELGTSDAAMDWTFTPTSMAFAEDDRLIVRWFITAAGGTMVAGTNTMTYDGPTSGAAGDTFVTLNETVAFKPDNLTQTSFRIYNDGTETGSTALAAQDTNLTFNPGNTANQHIQVRIRLQSTSIGGAATDDYRLFRSRNGGTYQETVSTFWPFGGGALTDDAATTNRLGAGSGSFVAGKIVAASDNEVTNYQITAGNYTELVWELDALADRVNGDTFDWRIYVDQGSGFGPLGNYTQTPRFTLQVAQHDLFAFRFYEPGTETGSVATAAQSTNITRDPAAAPNFFLRLGRQNTTAFLINDNSQLELFYRKNGGSWVSMRGNATNVVGIDDTNLSPGGPTTQRLTGGTGSFNVGQTSDNPGDMRVLAEIGASENAEDLFSCHLISTDLSPGDTLEFTVEYAGGDPNTTPTPIQITRTTIPMLTVAGPQAWSVTSTLAGVGSLSGVLRQRMDMDAALAGTGALSVALRQKMDLDAVFGGAGSLSADLRKAPLSLSATFGGTGALSADLQKVTPGIVRDLAATFGGVGALSATLSQRMDLDATFGGVGSLSVDAQKTKGLTATFGGIGGLTVALRQTMDFDVTLGGTGTLSADAQIPAPTGVVRDLAAAFNGVGTLSADLQKTKDLSATFAGTGVLSVDLQKTKLLSATFAGAGALSADLDLAMAFSAALNGAGALSVDVRKAALALSATFVGAGSLSATMRQNMDLDAVLAGAGTFSADARKSAIQLSATLSGTGSLTAVLGLVLPLRATYSGVGGLSVPLAQNMALSTLFQGSGTLSASADVPGIVNNWDFQAQFSGSGTMSVAMRQNMALATSYGGAGTLSATLSQRFLVASVFAGAGSLSVDAQKAALQVSSTLSGAGGLSATVGQSHALSAVLSGTGALSADTRKGALQLTATFGGLGTLSADIQKLIFLNATFGGQGSLSASIQQAMALQSSLAGTGTLSADIKRTIGVTASFAGAGTLSASLTQQMLLSASFLGSGTLFADLTRVTAAGTIWSLPTQFFGAGGLSATLQQNMALQATYSGVGTLSADMRKLLPLNATFSGIGSMSAALRIERGLSATFAGVGSLSAATSVRMAYSVALTGTGTMLVTVAQRHALSARFDGQGDLRADPFTHLAGAQPLNAVFAGEGTLTCNLLHVSHEFVPTYDYPIGRSLDSDYGRRRARREGRLVIGRR